MSGIRLIRAQKRRSDLNERGPNGWCEGLLEDAGREPNPSLYFITALCAKLGRTNEAIQLLKQCYDQHSPGMERLIEDASWDALRGEKEFQDLVKKMGFGPKQ